MPVITPTRAEIVRGARVGSTPEFATLVEAVTPSRPHVTISGVVAALLRGRQIIGVCRRECR